MVGRKSLATIATASLLLGCATAAPSPDNDDEAPIGAESIKSSSVRIERKRRGPAIAHVERGCDVGEVQRVIDLLAASGAGRVSLKVVDGAQADVVTHAPTGNAPWLVVALTDAGFKLFMSTAEALKNRGSPAPPAGTETSEVPLREGKPDWERLINMVRAMASKQTNLGGTSVAAPAAGPAAPVIEALQQIRFALPDSQRRYLLSH